jgi:hypothetical protein
VIATIMKPIVSAALGLLAALPVLRAADAEFHVRVLSFDPAVATTGWHAHHADGRTTAGKVQVKTFLNHEADVLTPGKDLKLVLTGDADPASALDPAKVQGDFLLPATKGSAILLLLPPAAGKSGSRVEVVDDSVKAFPPGSILVLNSCSLRVKVELEGKPHEIDAGARALIAKMPVGENNSAGMKCHGWRDGGWEIFSSGVWPHPGEKRVLQVITDGSNGTVDIRGVRDVATP